MSAQPMDAARVLQLKAEAKQLKSSRGIKQTQALMLIAQREGYRSWEDVVAEVGGRAVVRTEKLDLEPVERSMRRAARASRFGVAP